MKKWIALVLLGGFMPPLISSAIDLKQSKFTQVVNNVEIITADKALHAATVNDIFSMPDVLRTGPDSRAELEATDGTITRVGANTIFSFEPASRTIKLDQGSLLFHSPHGKGGGTIQTGSATASVIGTTIIVTATSSGGFKLLDLEGQAEVRYLDGLSQTLEPGQMTFILPGGTASPVIVFRLDSETKGSALVSGFDTPLDSQSKINSEITQQLLQILNGTAADTGYVVGNNASANSVQVIVANINDTPPQSSLPAQFKTDGSIIGNPPTSGDTLPVNYAPLDPNHLINTPAPFTLPASITTEIFPFSSSQGFAADNIDIDTANIDMSSFSGDFDFIAAGDMRIWQSLDFSSPPDSISLVAGGALSIAQGATVEADNSLFWLGAGSFNTLNPADGSILFPNVLDDVTIGNDDGELDIASASSLTVQDASYIWAEGLLTVTVDGDFDLTDGRIDTDSGDVLLQTLGGGMLTVGGTSGGVISAGGIIDLSSSAGVDIYNYSDLTAYGSDAGGVSMDIFSVGDSDVYDSYLYAYGGDLDITALGGIDMEGAYASASGGINLQAVGDISVYSSSLTASGLDLTISSSGGDLDIENNDIYTSGGDVTISASGTADIEDTYIEADGDMNIESGGTLYLGWFDDGDEIYSDDGTVNLKSDNADVDIYDYEIYTYGSDENGNGINISAGGNVDFEDSSEVYAYDGGISITANDSIYLYDDDIEAGEGSDSPYDLDVTSHGSTVDIDDAELYANGNVNVESGGTLTLEDYSEIDADGLNGISLTSENSDVDIYDSSLYAYGGDVNISASGTEDIEDTDIYAYGNVNINPDGTISLIPEDVIQVGVDVGGANVYISDSDIYAGWDSDFGGSVNITGSSVDVYDYSDIYAYGGDVNITSEGVVLDVDAIDIEDSEIYGGYDSDSGGSVNINANNGDAYLYDDDIYAYSGEFNDGEVNIYASGTADIEDTYIEADGDVNIESGGTLYLGWFEDGYDIYSDSGTVNLKSDNGDVDIDDYEIYTYGSDINGNGLNISAGGNVDFEDSSEVYAYDGGISITANGSIYLYDDDIETSDEYTDGSYDLDVTSDSTVDIDDTELYANGNVNVESGGTLTLEDYSEIDADGAGGISLISDNSDVDINNSSLYAYNAGVNINAAGSVDIENDSDIYAYDDVNINSSITFAPGTLKSSALTSLICGTGTVDIEDSYIYAGWGGDGSSFDGGSVNINAYNGDVYLYDDEIYADRGESSDGDINIYASRSVDLDYVYDLYADGDIYVESGDTLTVEDSSDLEAYNGDVTLISDNSDVNIYDSEVYSDYGSVNIYADNGGVYVSDGDIEAGYDSDVSTGDVNIRAYDGTVDIENSYISAQGNVNIESSGTLTLNYYEYNNDYSGGYEIYANNGSVSLKSDDGDVDITGYDIYAYGTDVDGNGLTITAAGNVSVSDSYFGIYNGGNISVNAGGNIDVLYTDGSGNGSINLTAGGYVNVYDDTMDIGSFYVTAGTYADFGADQYADIYDSSITANGGGVNITGNSAGVDIDDTSITATGDIDVTVGADNYDESPYISRRAAPSFVAPLDAGTEFVTLGTFTPQTFTTPPVSPSSEYLTLITQSSDIDLTGDDTIESPESLGISAGGNFNDPQVDLIADGGDLVVIASGAEVIDSAHLEANGSVYLTAVGSVSLSDSLASSDIYSDIYADNGDVDIQSSGGTVDIEDTYISANGSVNIDSFGTLTLGGTENSIKADNGDVSLTSDSADVDAGNYGIYSDYGNVNISAAGSVSLSGDSIYSGYDSDAGNANIQSLTGTVDIEDTYISAAGNVGILSFDTLTLGNSSGSEIDANGWANLSSVTGDADIDNYSIYTYGSDIDGNGITISAAAGSLSLSGDSINAYDSGDVTIAAQGAGGTADIEGTYIEAEGDVNIESDGTLYLGWFEDGDEIDAGGSVNLTSDNAGVDIYEYDIYADNGDVNITSDGVVSEGDAIDIEDSDIYGGYDSDSGGSVNINAYNGDIYLDENDIYTYSGDSSGGDVNLYASGTADIEDTYIEADGDMNIESGSTLTLEDSSDIESYGDNGISLASDNSDVDVYDSSLYAYHGDVDITAVSDSAAIDLEDGNISAYGNVNIESDGTLTLGDNSDNGFDTIYAGSGIYLSSDSGDVDVYNSTINGGFANDDDGFDGTVNDATIEDGSSLMPGGVANLDAYGAEISIHAAGIVDIEYTDIDPGGGINISDSTIIANGSDINGNGVNIYSDGYFYVGGYSDFLYDDDIEGNNISISDGSTITALNGGVSIVNDASFSTLDSVGFEVEGGTVMDYGDINISGGSTITANNGGVDIETASSDLSEVYVEEGSSLSVGDISIDDSTIAATGVGGDVTVYAGGYLTMGTELGLEAESGIAKAVALVYADSISADGDISLYGNSGASVDYVAAEAGGKFALESDYDVSVYDSSLTADTIDADIYADYGNVDFEYSTATATLGDVDIEAGYSDASGSETLTMIADSVNAGGSVTLSAPGSVSMTGGTVAGNSSVNVNAGTGITINGVAVTADDTTYGSIVLASTTGQTTIQSGSSLTAHTLTINSADGILIDGSSGGTISGNTMNLTAGSGDANGGPTISIQDADLSGFASINIVAHTLDFLNVGFGAGPNNFGSWNGVANINNGIVAGDVNFRNDTYVFNGSTTPINSLSQINYTSGPSSVPGLNVYSKQ